MAKYLLIESRDPFDSTDSERMYDLARGLADNGDDVTVYLVQNGVMPVRAGSSAAGQVGGLAERTTVLADDFSLRERGIDTGDLAQGVSVGDVDTLVDLVAEDDRKVIWH